MQCRQEEQRPNPLIQILGIAAELVEGLAGLQQLGQTGRSGPGFERAVAHGSFRRRDEVDERMGRHDLKIISEAVLARQLKLDPLVLSLVISSGFTK
jgi:hypothetical protein